MVEGEESYPLPVDAQLAEVAKVLQDSGQWANVLDDQWRLVFVTDESRRTFGAGELAHLAIGKHVFGPEATAASRQFRLGSNTDEQSRAVFAGCGGFVLTDAGGSHDAVRDVVDPLYHDLIGGLTPTDAAAHSFIARGTSVAGWIPTRATLIRIRDASGRLAGTVLISNLAVGMATIAAMIADSDTRHLERMQVVARAARRPAAILFADLESSTALAKRMSTAAYFALGRRWVRAADRCVIDAGGLVGRHVGDGVVAFFLAETTGSESAAARACITAARALRNAMVDVASRSNVGPDEVVLRFGLHWGSTLYVGNITTGGRTEVTALGDEVNESARIEACATGGRVLASKDLIERLDHSDAGSLGLGPDHLTYTSLADLHTATDKARRDAPAIAVCDLSE